MSTCKSFAPRRWARWLSACVIVGCRVLILEGAATRTTTAQIDRPRPLKPADGWLQEPLTAIGGVRELSDGTVLVSDRQDLVVFLGDFRSHAIRRVAGAGEGPGEFRSVEKPIAMGGDSTLFADRQLLRWVLFDGGRPVATWKQDPSVNMRAQETVGWALGRTATVQGVSHRRSVGVPFARSRSNAESLMVLIHEWTVGRGGLRRVRSDTVERIIGRAQGQTVARRGDLLYQLENPLAVEEQVVYFRDGWLALVRLAPYRVDWRAPDGSWRRGAPIEGVGPPVDATMQRALVAWQWPQVTPLFGNNELPPWPRFLPPFLNDAAIAAPRGMVAIRRAYNPTAPATVYDLVGRTGKLVDRIKLPVTERILGFGGNSVFVVGSDQDDVQRLYRHPWP